MRYWTAKHPAIRETKLDFQGMNKVSVIVWSSLFMFQSRGLSKFGVEGTHEKKVRCFENIFSWWRNS